MSVSNYFKDELDKLVDLKKVISGEKKSHRLFLKKRMIKVERSIREAVDNLKRLHMVA